MYLSLNLTGSNTGKSKVMGYYGRIWKEWLESARWAVEVTVSNVYSKWTGIQTNDAAHAEDNTRHRSKILILCAAKPTFPAVSQPLQYYEK